MMDKLFFSIAFFSLLVISTVSCSKDDEPKDKVKIITLYVSAETGMYQPWGSDEPLECMLVLEEGQEEYYALNFLSIEGFTYEKGYEYKLSVEKTTLANPPADGSSYTYKLREILNHEYMLRPEPIYTEDDIIYQKGCPHHIYDIDNPELFINTEGRLSDSKGNRYYYDLSRIYIKNALSWEDEYYNDLSYMAISAFVIDSFMQDGLEPSIRLIRSSGSGPAITDILTEEAFEYMKNEATVGEKITYKIILSNYKDLALQDVEVTFTKI